MNGDGKKGMIWFPGALALLMGFLVIVCVFILMPLPKAGQDYCNTLSGDAGETFVAAADHFCEYNCHYNVTKTPDGKYPPCKDHGYTYNRTAFLSALEHTE